MNKKKEIDEIFQIIAIYIKKRYAEAYCKDKKNIKLTDYLKQNKKMQ